MNTTTDTPATPLQASLIKAQERFHANLTMLNALAAECPELHNWEFAGIDSSGLKLLQGFPAKMLGRKTLVTQTSAMVVVRVLARGSATVNGSGSVEFDLRDGHKVILHEACAEFLIPLDRKEATA